MRREAPPGWEVTVVRAPTSSDGDGPAGGSDEAVRLIPRRRGVLRLRHSRRICWPRRASCAGCTARRRGWATCSTRGSATATILRHQLGGHPRPADRASSWWPACCTSCAGSTSPSRSSGAASGTRRFFVADDSPLRELADCRVLIIGAGGLGGEAARRLSALGARCVGLRRRPELGAPEGFAEVAGLDALERRARRGPTSWCWRRRSRPILRS